MEQIAQKEGLAVDILPLKDGGEMLNALPGGDPLGADTDAVLRAAGISEDGIAALRTAGIISPPRGGRAAGPSGIGRPTLPHPRPAPPPGARSAA